MKQIKIMKQIKMMKQIKIMKQIKMIFIIIFSIALFGCGSNHINGEDISDLMNWVKPDSSNDNTSHFTTVPPDLIQPDGTGTNNPTQIKFAITGTAVDNCEILALNNLGGWGNALPTGTTTGITYNEQGQDQFLSFRNCTADSTVTVSIEYKIGTKNYSGTTPTITINKTP